MGDDVGAVVRIAHVDDHEAMRLGFRAIVGADSAIELVASTASVDALEVELAGGTPLDLVVLDLRLMDQRSAASNVGRLVESGRRVLCYTGAEDPAPVREAVVAGALGVIRKSESAAVLLDAIHRAAAGETIPSLDWAAALDGDPALAAAKLSPQEQQVLALYASGEKTAAVGRALGVSEKTVAEYVRRIRAKYALAGRPAHSRIDLYKRAVEDGYVGRSATEEPG